MKILYFEDTDTVLIPFSKREVFETREISEDVYLDFDEEGDIVGMTLEHAIARADIAHLSFDRVSAQASQTG
jgi:uncharacterized protein YuzE